MHPPRLDKFLDAASHKANAFLSKCRGLHILAAMAALDAFVVIITSYIIDSGREHARSTPVLLDFLISNQPLLCHERAAPLACAQFLKAGWSYGETWIALIIVGLLTFTLSVYFTYYMCERRLTRSILFGTALIFSLIVSWLSLRPGKLYDLTGNSAASDAPHQGVFDVVYPALDMTVFLNGSINIASVVSASAAAFAGAACAATVVDLPRWSVSSSLTESDFICSSVKQMSIRFYRLRVIIAVGAVLLVLGVLATSGYLTWPNSFVRNNNREVFRSLTDGVVLVVGTQYTMFLLLGFFLPAGQIFLSARSLAIKAGSSSQKEIDSYLNDCGLVFSLPGILKDSLTVIAPFIASSLVSAAKLVT